MAKVTGTVVEITTRAVAGKFGKPGTAYGIKLDNGNTYSAGFKSPHCSVGDNVTFDVIVNGKYENADSASIVINGKGTAAPTPSYSGGAGRSGGFPVATDSDKYAIIRQNALAHAVATVGAFYGNGCIAIWEGGDANFDVYVEKVIETAYKFTDFSSGQREVKAVEEAGKSE